eukprot:491762-Ditylum_brightwellii.AAC.1
MSNILYFEKFKHLVNVAEKHGANLGLHQGLIKQVAANTNAPTQEEKDESKANFLGRIFILKVCCFRYQKLKEELYNKVAQGWNGYPDSVEKACTMLCERRDNGMPRITTESQLAFHVEGKGGHNEGGEEEIVPPTGGGKVKPYIRCNKCNKKGHYINKCPNLIKEKEEEVLAFIIKEEEDPHNNNSDRENKFIFLTA